MQTISYTFDDGFLEKRVAHRTAHLDYLNSYEKQGKIIAGGALTNSSTPTVRGLILFRGSAEEAQHVVLNDPYYKAGLIVAFDVNDWTVVVGDKMEDLK